MPASPLHNERHTSRTSCAQLKNTYRSVREEEVVVVLRSEVEGCGWGSVLAAGSSAGGLIGRGMRGKRGRFMGRGLDFEVLFTLNTLGVVLRGLGREKLRAIAATGVGSTGEERAKGIAAAMKYLLQVEGVCGFLVGDVCEGLASSTGDDSITSSTGEKDVKPPETSPQVQGGMRELAMAEATLLAVLKDDPYPAVVVQERDKNDKEWMIKAPEIPKVRAHLFARLCIAAGEHAGRAEAILGSFRGKGVVKVDEDITRYASDLKKTARAKACRFFGIDEELGGETGKAIAWLRGARKELGLKVGEEGEKGWAKGWGKLKKGFDEKREDKKLEKGGEWGADAGRMEEGRILEMLEKKWVKLNDTINTQLVPPFAPLLAGMPSGREIHSSTIYVPPELDVDILEKMRAPPDPEEAKAFMAEDDDSSDDEAAVESGLPGAYLGKSPRDSTAREYY
ncbi:MAG: hypothetical protein L6R41_007516 [Letrouitia leprolyta]|nr:MAG: hypothetical protein L6R41_007516 [Letrouitia leprolyta]